MTVLYHQANDSLYISDYMLRILFKAHDLFADLHMKHDYHVSSHTLVQFSLNQTSLLMKEVKVLNACSSRVLYRILRRIS
jgi:hypothetical protein